MSSKMCDEYDEHAKKYFDTENEFKLDRIRNYLSPIVTYFDVKKEIKKEKIEEEKLTEILGDLEKQCFLSLDKIKNFL